MMAHLESSIIRYRVWVQCFNLAGISLGTSIIAEDVFLNDAWLAMLDYIQPTSLWMDTMRLSMADWHSHVMSLQGPGTGHLEQYVYSQVGGVNFIMAASGSMYGGGWDALLL